MTSKINGPGPGTPPAVTQKTGNAERGRAGETVPDRGAAASADSARVQVTESARRLERLEEVIRSLPDVDQGRVDAIREQIASGEFDADPARIAEKLLRFERDMGE